MGKAIHPGFGSAKHLIRLARFIRYPFGQLGTDDHLGHQPIGAGGEAISNAQIHVEASDLKIDHCIEIVLLLIEGQSVLRPSEVGVIFKSDGEILTELRAKRAAGAKSAPPFCPIPKSTIGLIMNS